MGKKQRREKVRDGDDSSTDSEGSLALTKQRSFTELLSTEFDDVHEQIELLWGKHGSQTKLRALTNLTTTLIHLRAPEAFSGRIHTMLQYAQNLAKLAKSTTPERVMSCRLIAITGICFDDDDAGTWSDLGTELLRVAKDPVAPEAVRASAIDTLAMIIILKSRTLDPDVHDSLLSGLQSLFQGNVTTASEKVVSSAVRGFAVVASMSRGVHPRLKECETTLMDLLQRPTSDVVVAAGETIALLHELGQESGGKGCRAAIPVFRQLVGEHGHLGKSQRQEVAATLRDVLAFLEGGDPPSETMTIAGHRLEFSSYREALLLAAFRNILGPGLPLYIQSNPQVRMVFSIDAAFAPRGRISKAERRALHDEAEAVDKETTIERSKIRRGQIARLHDDDE